MPCGKSQDEAVIESKIIDKGLKLDKKKLKSVTQLLLLGTGESGKTTIIKQMKILHINGFSESEKLEKIPYIRQNIHESIYTLVTSMKKISPPTELQNQNSKEAALFISQFGIEEPPEYSNVYFDQVKILWDDPGIKETFRRSNEFQLIDSAQHFLDKIDVVKQSDYVPTVQDILFCRIMTMAISKIEFEIPYRGDKVKFWMFDVGGQRGQRRKWIPAFEGMVAILFLIAASDFDQTLREDETKNRLEEAFKVFNDIFWNRFVRKTGKIVFLNKQDLLKQKIESGKKIEKYFPEYSSYVVKDKSANSEYDRANYFIRDKIIEMAENVPGPEIVEFIPGNPVPVRAEPQQVYIHFTTATDTKNIKLIFDSIKDIIINWNIERSGLL